MCVCVCVCARGGEVCVGGVLGWVQARVLSQKRLHTFGDDHSTQSPPRAPPHTHIRSRPDHSLNHPAPPHTHRHISGQASPEPHLFHHFLPCRPPPSSWPPPPAASPPASAPTPPQRRCSQGCWLVEGRSTVRPTIRPTPSIRPIRLDTYTLWGPNDGVPGLVHASNSIPAHNTRNKSLQDYSFVTTYRQTAKSGKASVLLACHALEGRGGGQLRRHLLQLRVARRSRVRRCCCDVRFCLVCLFA